MNQEETYIMVLKGATMSHRWKNSSALSSRYINNGCWLLDGKKQETKREKNFCSCMVWNKTWCFLSRSFRIRRAGVCSLSAWEQRHLTVSSPADQRITPPGGLSLPCCPSYLKKTLRYRKVFLKVSHHWAGKCCTALFCVYFAKKSCL